MRAHADAQDEQAGDVGVAGYLAPLAGGFVLDSADQGRAGDVRALGLRTVCVPTLMHDAESAAALARAALAL